MGLIGLLWAVNIAIKIMHFTVSFSSSFSRPPKWTTTSFPRKDLPCQEKISAKSVGCFVQRVLTVLRGDPFQPCAALLLFKSCAAKSPETRLWTQFLSQQKNKAFRRRSLYLRLKCSLKWPKGTWMWKHGWHSRHCWRIGWKELQKKKRCLCHRMTWTIMEVGAKPGTYKNSTVLNKCHSENTWQICFQNF